MNYTKLNQKKEVSLDKKIRLKLHIKAFLQLYFLVKTPCFKYYKPTFNYYPFGMLQPNRHKDAKSYRYGFQGQEKDDEVKGEGNSINYKERMYDTRIGKFLSIDPLTREFPTLTPYQFASNDPISNVDLDGLEGVSYRVVSLDKKTGKKIPIKRVIELDVHIAVNSTGSCGAYTPEVKNTIFLDNSKKFNNHKFKDDEGLDVIFKFNYISFDPELIDKELLAHSLFKKKTKTLHTTGVDKVAFETRKGVAIWKDNSINPYGEQSLSKIKINDAKSKTVYPIGYSESHEITHFFLMAEGFTNEAPDDDDDHTYRGFMSYAKITIIKEEDGTETKTVSKPKNELSKKAFKRILKAVPKIDDKIK